MNIMIPERLKNLPLLNILPPSSFNFAVTKEECEYIMGINIAVCSIFHELGSSSELHTSSETWRTIHGGENQFLIVNKPEGIIRYVNGVTWDGKPQVTFIQNDPTEYCGKCSSPRVGPKCWKCGAFTYKPVDGWENPATPDVNRIRKIASEMGYAIAVHGSQERDLDLIAVPWVENAIGQYHIADHIAQQMDGRVINNEQKPHGRIAFTIQIDGYFKPIDLSVC